MNAWTANTAWLAASLPEHARFRRAAAGVRAAQASVLERIIRDNAGTDFGRQHGFGGIRTIADYRRQVPLRDASAYADWIDRMARGERHVLTRDRVRLFEPTSGSHGPSKLVPYTDALRREFHRGVRPWIAGTFLRMPRLLGGPAYWCITPVAHEWRRTPGGVPVGFDDDAAYVGGLERRLARSVMVVPSSDRAVSDVTSSQYLTLLRLLRCRDLRLLSVWSPSFLEILTDRLVEWGERLVFDLERGTFQAEAPESNGLRSASLRPDARAATRLREALRADPAERHVRLWPALALVSLWMDANAAPGAARIARLFPQAALQGKGLVATEGIVSLPIGRDEGAALAVRSHFLEFLPVGAGGAEREDAPCDAADLEMGARYSVVITTGGGLYRYRLEDVLEVTGQWASCPLVRFVGRLGVVADWVGEKLCDAHVSDALARVYAAFGLQPAFSLLACDTGRPRASYVWYVDAAAPDAILIAAARAIDRELHENYHYRYARRLGQLGPVRACRAENGASRYLRGRTDDGQRAGSVKPAALERSTGWTARLGGVLIETDERPASGVGT